MKEICRSGRLYRRFQAATSWMPAKPLMLLQAIWLGLLDADALNDITHASYEVDAHEGFAQETFNFQGLWPWEHSAVQSAFRGCRSVLIAGAGGGREPIALALLGFEVTAFDFCAELTFACRRYLEKANLVAHVLDAQSDRVPGGLGRFDAILVGRGFYHHIPNRARRIAFLRQCRRHIRTDAPVLIADFFTRQSPSKAHERTRAIANLVRRVRRCPERVELGDWLSQGMQHAFTREEIAAEMAESGFRIESYADSPFGDQSRHAHAVGRALPDDAT
jgi:SAM-dependent methyltransferase